MINLIPKIDPVLPVPERDEQVVDWLNSKAAEERPFLLAFADDGVIWGKWVDGELKTAPQSLKPVQLRGETLQQAYLFGSKNEVRLFRTENRKWKAVYIEDVPGQDALDEYQILAGDMVVGQAVDGFTHLRDKRQQGLDQIVPMALSDKDLENQALRLNVRHFLTTEESGETRIFLSRLVQFGLGPLDEENLNEEMTK